MKLNGNLTLNAGGLSEVQNFIIERVSSLPTATSAEAGRLVFATTNSTYYFNNGTEWVALATGGNAAALQSEVDAVEASLGSMVNANGTFNAAAFSAFTNVASPTSVQNALSQLDAAIAGKNELSELLDVSVSGRATGDYLKYNGSVWVADALTLADVTNVTASAAEVNQLTGSGVVTADLTKLHAVTATATELNVLAGIPNTLTATELGYVDGVTSAIQDQLDNKQPLDAQLTSIAGLTPADNDVLVGNGGGTYELLTGAGFRSSQGLVIGTDIQAFDADLTQLGNFAPADSEFLVGTGNGAGDRWVLESGAVVRTSLGLGDIATQDQASFIKTNGTSTITAAIPMNNQKITGLAAPTADQDAANKGYVDAVVAGLTWKNSVKAATVANVTLSGAQTIDGVSLVAGDRVLVRAQTTSADNGIYVVAAGAWTRSTDADSTAELANAAVFVQDGTTLADTAWTQVATVATVGTDTVTFNQFSGSSVLTPGIGLSQSGNVFNINMGAGIAQLPSDEVGIDLYDAVTGAIILTEDGSTRAGSPGTDAKLHLKVNTTQFNQDATNGLFIKPAGVTETELAGSVAGNGLVGGAGSALAVASAAGSAGTVGTLVITADAVGVALGTTSTTAAPGNHIHAADVVTFDNTSTALSGGPANVQDAIEALDAAVDAIGSGNIPTIQAEIDAIETGVGLNTDGTYTAIIGANYATSSTLKGAVDQLDDALKAEETARIAVNTRLTSSYYVYTGASATSHTVNHTCGVKYCNVTVVDASDEVVIPQSILFNAVGQLTVTFNSAIACKVVVTGVA